MNACMYVCISMVLCSVSCLPLLFITLIVISHRFICDCVYFFLLIVNFLLRFGFILIMCVYCSLLPSVSSVFICRFVYLCSLNTFLLKFPFRHFTFCFVICFLVMHALFSRFVLYLLHPHPSPFFHPPFSRLLSKM